MNVSGKDQMLVTGLGPVGLAAAMLARGLGVKYVIGVDVAAERCQLAGKLSCALHASSASCFVRMQEHVKHVCQLFGNIHGQLRSKTSCVAEQLGLVDVSLAPDASAKQRILDLSGGGCEVAVDCSGEPDRWCCLSTCSACAIKP